MAYITAQQVDAKRKALKAAFPGWKFSVTKHHHSRLNVAILAAPIDFLSVEAMARPMHHVNISHEQAVADVKACGTTAVNHYYLADNWQGDALKALQGITKICMDGNHDNSDAGSDYFDVGWYFNLKIGQYDKPFVVIPAKVSKKEAA